MLRGLKSPCRKGPRHPLEPRPPLGHGLDETTQSIVILGADPLTVLGCGVIEHRLPKFSHRDHSLSILPRLEPVLGTPQPSPTHLCKAAHRSLDRSGLHSSRADGSRPHPTATERTDAAAVPYRMHCTNLWRNWVYLPRNDSNLCSQASCAFLASRAELLLPIAHRMASLTTEYGKLSGLTTSTKRTTRSSSVLFQAS